MSGNLVSDNSVLHILFVRKAKVLLRSDIAKHCRAMPPDHRRTDSRRDVIVARSNVGDERPKCIERRFIAKLSFFVHLLLDLVHRNMSWALDHDLHVILPGFPGKLTQSFQLGELHFIAGIGDTPGTEPVAERKGYVMLYEYSANILETFVQEILLVMMRHPLRQYCATAAHDSSDAFGDQRQILDQNAGVDSHVIHTLFSLLFNDFQQDLGVEVLYSLHA